MKTLNTAILSALLFLVTTSGCAQEDLPPPKLQEVCRADTDPVCLSQAWAGERITLRMEGSDLHPTYQVDLGDKKQPLGSTPFLAWIGGSQLEQVHLSDYYGPGQTLLGDLPGDLPLGQYDLVVQSPAGERATRPDAFTIGDPLRVEARIDKPTLPLGDTAQLLVTVSNLGPTEISQVALSLEQDNGDHFSLPQAGETITISGAEQANISLTLLAHTSGTGRLTVSASAVAGEGLPLGPTAPVEVESIVVEQALLELSAQLVPTTLRQGEAITLNAILINSGALAVHEVQMLEPVMSGDGSIQWDSPTMEHISIQPGGNQQIQLSGYAATSGTVMVSPILEAQEDISGRTFQVQSSDPIEVSISP